MNMIDELVADMEDWDNDNILGWAQRKYREELELMPPQRVRQIYDNVLGSDPQ